jgi:hypothetical protein
VQQQVESPEMVDLVDVDDDEKYEDFKAKQQAELIKQQQLDEATKPAKLADFQCIICMDNPTDLTVTHCGMSLLNPVLNLSTNTSRPPLLFRMPSPSSLCWEREEVLPSLPNGDQHDVARQGEEATQERGLRAGDEIDDCEKGEAASLEADA